MMADPDRPNLPAFRYPVAELLKEISTLSSPGGLGTAALLAAVASALVTRIGRQTLGLARMARSDGYAPVAEEMQRVANRAEALGELLLAAIDQDAQLQNRLAQAAALPTDTPEEQEIRRGCHQSALRHQVQLELSLAATALEVGTLAETVARYGFAGARPEAELAARTSLSACYGLLQGANQVLPLLSDLALADQQTEKHQDLVRKLAALEADLAELLSAPDIDPARTRQALA